MGFSGTFSDASTHGGQAGVHAHGAVHAGAHAGIQTTQRSAHASFHAGHTHEHQPKTKIGKRLKAVEWQQEIINAKTRCTYCGSHLSLLKRPVCHASLDLLIFSHFIQ